MIMCEEMQKLRKALDERKIEWEDKSTIPPESVIEEMISQGIERKYADSTMFRTHFGYGGYRFSVIYGYGSYSGVDPFSGRSSELLECMTEKVNGGEPIGHLTAKDVLDIIDGTYKEREQNAD